MKSPRQDHRADPRAGHVLAGQRDAQHLMQDLPVSLVQDRDLHLQRLPQAVPSSFDIPLPLADRYFGDSLISNGAKVLSTKTLVSMDLQ